jgi:very-short-patch-repair endonuclease
LGDGVGVPLATAAIRNPPGSPPTIEALAATQKDLITWEQLRAFGLSPSAISHRVKRGTLTRRHRRVYSLGAAPLSQEAGWPAAVIAAGPGAVLSHGSAAQLHGVRSWRPPLIAVVSTRKRRPHGVKVHTVRNIDPRDVTTERGIPVTTVHRTIVDLADELSPHELANVIHEAAHLGRWVEAAVRDCAARLTGRQNLDVLEEAIALYNDGSAGSKSRAELALALRAADLPRFRHNVHVEDIEVDFHFPTLALVLEIDGPDHGRPSTRREDKLKERILTGAGYEVLRFPDTTPTETIVAAVSARRPRPSSSCASRAA